MAPKDVCVYILNPQMNKYSTLHGKRDFVDMKVLWMTWVGPMQSAIVKLIRRGEQKTQLQEKRGEGEGEENGGEIREREKEGNKKEEAEEKAEEEKGIAKEGEILKMLHDWL